MPLIDAAAGLLFSGAALWCGYALACRIRSGDALSVRASAAGIIVVWLLSVGFFLLSVPRLFTRPAALALWVAAAIAAHRYATGVVDLRTRARADAASARAWWRRFNSPLRILAGVAAVVVAARAGHGLLAPPLTWDALTYHLYKPVMWIHARGFVSTTGPDAAAYYQWFPPYGDVMWAWSLLATRGDALIAVTAAATWVMALVGCYGAARALGASERRATLAAFAAGFTPAVVDFVAAPHVDNLVLALFCTGALFLGFALDRREPQDAVLAAAAFGVLAGVKSSALPVCVVGIIAAAFAVRGSLKALAGVAVAAAPAALPPLVAWRATGSPLYPLTLRVGGRVVFAGNAELDWLLRGEWMNPALAEIARAKLAERMLLPWVRLDGDFMNLGLGAVFVSAAAAGGLWTLRSSAGKRRMLAFYALAAFLTLASVAGRDAVALRLWWWPVLGRLVTIAVGALAIVGAAWPHRLATGFLFAAAAVSIASSWPTGLTVVDVRAGAYAGGSLLSIAAAWWLLSRVTRRRMLLTGLAALLMTVSLLTIRGRFRAEYFAAAGQREAFDVHPLDGRWVRSWPLWDRFDTDVPLTLAVSAGWDGMGHNWWLYPLAGRHLQNRLLYVPVSRDGAIFDYGLAPARVPPTSCDAWVTRLLASGADFLVLLPPLPAESRWARALPDIFRPDMQIEQGGASSYRIFKGVSAAAARCPQK